METEILIIGARITGSLTAHQCVKDGFDTVVIDRREVCQGSTSATTSMLQYEIDVPLYQLTVMIGEEAAVQSYRARYKAIDDLGKISKEINGKSGFNRKKSLYFVASKKDLEWMTMEFESRKKAGFCSLAVK